DEAGDDPLLQPIENTIEQASSFLHSQRPASATFRPLSACYPNRSLKLATILGVIPCAAQHEMMRRRHGIHAPAEPLLLGSRICDASLRAASRPGRPG